MKIAHILERLRSIEAGAIELAQKGLSADFDEDLKVYEDRLKRLEVSHSRSLFGDHSTTYYTNFESPPAGHSFDIEWGLLSGLGGAHNPDWKTYSREELQAFVFDGIREDVFYAINALYDSIHDEYAQMHQQSLDCLDAIYANSKLSPIERYKSKIETELTPIDISSFVNSYIKKAPTMTRDSAEISKPMTIPVHIQYNAPIEITASNKRRLRTFAATIRSAIEAIEMNMPMAKTKNTGVSKVFIGHGRSNAWRELKDFVQDKLGLDYEEFNRVPTAGIATKERLTEMLHCCDFAFLVFTAEDTHADGSSHARENVIHEAGLFQGHLDWRRAIVILEDGCEEFSNIVGLGQIRFPKGSIRSCFEDIRDVLEREGVATK